MSGRMFIVAPGVLNVTAEQLMAYLVGLAGPGAARLLLTDEDLDLARAGGMVDRAITVPQDDLSDAFRAFVEPGAPPEIPVWLQVRPWMRQTGTTTDADGNTVPVYERVGTLIDLTLAHVDVRGLEQALRAALPQDQVTRSDGTTVPAAASPIGLRLVPSDEVQTPAVEYPEWSPPQVVTDPLPPE